MPLEIIKDGQVVILDDNKVIRDSQLREWTGLSEEVVGAAMGRGGIPLMNKILPWMPTKRFPDVIKGLLDVPEFDRNSLIMGGPKE
jgi:hypothetical protein